VFQVGAAGIEEEENVEEEGANSYVFLLLYICNVV
jgi:hypothetical protein